MIERLPHANYQAKTQTLRRQIETSDSGRYLFGQRKPGSALFKRLLRLADDTLGWLGIRDSIINWLGRPRLRRLVAHDPILPKEFDGYRILHLTDLHLELTPQIVDFALATLAQREDTSVDLVVITGDFRDYASYEQLREPLAKLIGGIPTQDGIVATLGNHDSLAALELLSDLGIKVLMNASAVLRRGPASLVLTALEDSHYYFSSTSIKALTLPSAEQAYRVLLAHTPDFYRWAEVAGYRLYFCGHTHGGQICAPGGHPLLLHTLAPLAIVREAWQQGNMLGFTGRGLGFSRLAIRSFCPPELALITLRTDASAHAPAHAPTMPLRWEALD